MTKNKIARCVIDCAINDINDSVSSYEEMKNRARRECLSGIVPLLEDNPNSGNIEDRDVSVVYGGGEYIVKSVYLNNEKKVYVNIGGISFPIEYCKLEEIMNIASSVVEEYKMWCALILQNK